jgi:MFS family permease
MTLSVQRVLRGVFGEHASLWHDREFQPIAGASVATSMGLAVISPILTLLAAVYGVSESSAGLLMAAYSGSTLVLFPFVGIIGDRYGRKPLLVGSLVLIGAAGLGLALTRTFWIAVGLRGLQGLAWAGISSMTITLIGDRYGGEEGNAAQAFRTFTIQATGMIVPIVVVWLVVFAWQFPFALYAVAFPLALFAHLVLDESAAEGTESRLSYTQSLYTVVRKPVVLPVLLSFFPRMVIRYGFLSFISALAITHLGYGPGLTGVLVSTAAGAKMVTTSQLGRLTALASSRFRIVIVGFLFAGAGMVGLGLTASVPLLVVATASTGVGDGLLSPTQKGMLVDNVSAEYRGGLVGIGMFSQNAGATVAPLALGGLLLVLDIGTVFVLTGLVNMIGGIILVLVATRTAGRLAAA